MATQLKESEGVAATPPGLSAKPEPKVSALRASVPNADPLRKLREPFAPHHISKLPKPTKAQTESVRADFKKGIRCKECGSWHHPEVIHLDYVGHAALTDRLLDVDPFWYWEPLAFTEIGLPAFDQTGGLWIKLTVDGMTRLGYGHAAAKSNADPGAREKEVIGDALRNAAMRFGAALDLWHKGDLHAEDDATPGADQGHSEERAVSPDGPVGDTQAETRDQPKKGWREPESVYSTPTKLHAALITHQAELNRLGIEGTFDDLDGYLTAPEYQEFVRVAGLHAPHYLDGELPEGCPPEFIQTFALEQKARDMIAIRGNVAGEVEPA
jgi:hypothetical protein